MDYPYNQVYVSPFQQNFNTFQMVGNQFYSNTGLNIDQANPQTVLSKPFQYTTTNFDLFQSNDINPVTPAQLYVLQNLSR